MHDTPIAQYTQSLYTRFACKRYSDLPISEQQLRSILEAGRLSPTSFGLEGWHFHVVTDPTLRPAMTQACFDQESVATAPITVVIAARTASSYDPEGEFVRDRGIRFPGTLREFIDDYRGYYTFLSEWKRLDCWSRSQCYIAAANMMQAAALMGIQSCAIEGFNEDLVAPIIALDRNLWQVALLITFGYPDEPAREKIRAPLESLVTFH
jgi:nitroreductase